MGSRIVKKLGLMRAASEMTARSPWEWQLEACRELAGLARPLRAPPELEGWAEAERVKARLAVRQAAAILLRDATRKAQQAAQRNDISEARYYRAVRPAEIAGHIDPSLAPLLALGPRRTLRQALGDAAALLPPGQLWRARRGWRSLGEPHPSLRPDDGVGWLSVGALRNRKRRAGVAGPIPESA